MPVTCIGIVTAMDFEARALGKAPCFVVRRCGMSGAGAGRAVRELAEHRCILVVSWGTAGGLSAHLRSGDLYLANLVLARNGRRLATDTGWRERFEDTCGDICALRGGTLLDSPKIVTEPAEKERLRLSTGANAIDMESGPVAEACVETGLPFLVVRAIIDEAGDRLPSAPGLRPGAETSRTGALLASLILQPRVWPHLGRLARGYRNAKGTLTTAAAVLARCTEAAS